MNIYDLREAQARYVRKMSSIIAEREELYEQRSFFVKHFTEGYIKQMGIDEFVIGKHQGQSFCYVLERKLDGLGRIIGATALKFGVYYGRTRQDDVYQYRYAEKWGNSYKSAFENIRSAILEVLYYGKENNLELLVHNPLSPMFKGKILSIYYPEQFLNIFSSDHLSFFISRLCDEIIDYKIDAIYQREMLVNFKNSDPIMKSWSLDIFTNFLYNEYPGRPNSQNEIIEVNAEKILEKYFPIDFPNNQKAIFKELAIAPFDENNVDTRNERIRKKSKNTDYEEVNRNRKRLGEQGEKLVLDLEKRRLRSEGRDDLAIKVKRVSLDSDSLGYDILSFDLDGNKRYIEVKATQSSKKILDFFISENEYLFASSCHNHYIYIVYDILSITPKVWPLKNLFNPENENLSIKSVNYKVSINSVDKKKL